MPKTVVAPNVFVALGRPKGERLSYKQWEESGIPPQVVFEFQSESNTQSEMNRKLLFFSSYDVLEYYLYDIERKYLQGFIRFHEDDDMLEEIPNMNDWRSPRLDIRFSIENGALVLYKPDNTAFLTNDDYINIQQLLDNAELRANEERQRADVLAAKLRELGINPDAV